MKILKSSHRENKRYLLIKGRDADKKSIEEAILEAIGILGFSEASPKIVRQGMDSLIVAINRECLNKIRASFLISGKDIKIIKVSGTIKGVIK